MRYRQLPSLISGQGMLYKQLFGVLLVRVLVPLCDYNLSLYSDIGMDSLAQTQDNMIIAFTSPGEASESRLTAQLAHARQQSRRGQLIDALVGLLSPCVWKGLNAVQKETWAREIWMILEGRARRRCVAATPSTGGY
jgi:hypothetical protein